MARIFLTNPSIIVLDEATASLDTYSELKIKDILTNLTDKTVIIIAHRLSTVKSCDKIIVLQNKNIVEEGNYEELVNRKGIFYNMLNDTKK